MSTFADHVWHENLDLYRATLNLPFNRELSEGTLDEQAFRRYMIQDAHYLEGFARALSLVAAKGVNADQIVQFAEAASVAIVVERSLHAEYFNRFGVTVEDFEKTERSPICEHYVSFLLSTAALQPVEVGVAALLPCFWIYREVGHDIHRSSAGGNPFEAWIATYAGDEFSEAVDRVITTVNSLAEEASARERRLMEHVYKRSAQLEWMFWDGAYRNASWPV